MIVLYYRTTNVTPLKEKQDLNGNSHKGVKRIASPIEEEIGVTKKKGRRIIESDDESSDEEQKPNTENVKMETDAVAEVKVEVIFMI